MGNEEISKSGLSNNTIIPRRRNQWKIKSVYEYH